jgi:hypothetical protein
MVFWPRIFPAPEGFLRHVHNAGWLWFDYLREVAAIILQIMSTKYITCGVVALLLFPVWAHAEIPGGGQNTPLSNLLWSVLPVVVWVVVIFAFVVAIKKREQDPLVRRAHEHYERVEQSLERIAKALEKKD